MVNGCIPKRKLSPNPLVDRHLPNEIMPPCLRYKISMISPLSPFYTKKHPSQSLKSPFHPYINTITVYYIYPHIWIVYMYISPLHPSMTYITPSYRRYIPHYIPLQWASHEALECIAVCTGAQPRALPGHQWRADQGNQGTIWEFEWEEHGKIWKNMGTIYPPLDPPIYPPLYGRTWEILGKITWKSMENMKNHRKIWESKRNV